MLNEKELMILSELRKDSRQSLTDISRKTNIPVSTIFDNLIKLNKGIVKKKVSLLNFDVMGYPIFVNLIVRSSGKKNVERLLLSKPNVNSLSRTKGENCFFIQCFFRNMSEFESFKDELNEMGAKELKEFHVIGEIKREVFLTNESHIKMALENKEDLFFP
ncbi:MAG: Lrp/AsnC family transcriptional regulator [Nanoarchaeota archaeon]|nr:Lrp/AsnC family transcriptional regulator [Nanoarchaeota archaeon]MBU1004479.1 Lrp/AsnC family transcriptional regulator [Nanoarchaeota archaeon]MBU1945649.1 Lrp/AsnC family transcriptional regulator [Nanoarchaeota archaeon]